MSMRRVKRWNIASYLILVAMSVFVLIPFLWTFVTSIKQDVQMFEIPPSLIPRPPTLDHYSEILEEGRFVDLMRNSVVVAVASTALSLVIGLPAAYGFARFRFRVGGVLFGFIIAVRMFPSIVLVVPYFVMMRDLELIDTVAALIITSVPLTLTLTIWIMEAFFREVPGEIEEAAAIDGVGRFGVFFRIALPLALPAIAVAAIFAFLVSWNEFMFALTLTRTGASQTLPIGVAGYVTSFQTFWGKMSATGMLYVLPVLLFTLFAQRGLVKGLTAGSLKG